MRSDHLDANSFISLKRTEAGVGRLTSAVFLLRQASLRGYPCLTVLSFGEIVSFLT